MTERPRGLLLSLAAVLLATLTAAGCRVQRDGNTIRVRAPAGVLTDALREQRQHHKAVLLELLGVPQCCPICGDMTISSTASLIAYCWLKLCQSAIAA